MNSGLINTGLIEFITIYHILERLSDTINFLYKLDC